VSSVRINQRLETPYNPDGTPGTVSTGAPGAPGRAPLAEEIYAAVTEYIAANPITTPTASSSLSEFNKYGSGATGHPGTYVDIGSHSTLSAYVTAGGTPQTINLYLQAKNGTVVSSSPMEVQGSLSARGEVVLHDNTLWLREDQDFNYYVGYQAGFGTVIYGTTGGIGNGTNNLGWDATKFTYTKDVVVTGSCAVASPVVGTDTALSTATEIKAATPRKTAANRRGFVQSELPTDCIVNGQIDVLGVLATLWAQVKALTP